MWRPTHQIDPTVGLNRWFGSGGAIAAILSIVTFLVANGPAHPHSSGDSLSFSPSPPKLANLRTHVEELASPAYEGRRGAGAARAADYISKFFRDLKLEPLFGSSYVQRIPGLKPGESDQGRNVAAGIAGSDPLLRDEWIVVSAHFDHLGVRNGVLYPGADDDASGIAMLLETARACASLKAKPKRSLMFIAFDLEEIGLFGSRYFADHPPFPIDRIKLFLSADMIGRALGGVCLKHVFVMGTEHSPELRDWIDADSKDLDVVVGLLGTDVVGTRSDYGPFRNRQVPFLFFSTGENPAYHSPKDRPETLDYPKLTAISTLIERLAWRAAQSTTPPVWLDESDYPPSEAQTLRQVFTILLEHCKDLRIGAFQQSMMKSSIQRIDSIKTKGPLTRSERSNIVRIAQIVMFTVL